MQLNMGSGQIFFTAKKYKKDTSISFMIENEEEAFNDPVNLSNFPLHLAFASRGEFKQVRLLNVY